MDPVRRAYLELHIAVFLFGFTAILGDLIELNALVLVWWRVLLTSISLIFFIKIIRLFKTMEKKRILQFAGIGILVALHWLAFYGSIKLANASIALVCMATTSFFTSLMEPAIMRYRFRWYEVGLGLLVIPGMWLIANTSSPGMMSGIWVGLIAAFLASLFAILNKKLITKANPIAITFLELSSAWIFLCLIIPFYFWKNPETLFLPPDWQNWAYILVLALLCTTLAYVLSIRSLMHISAFASNLTVNLEPVYGIALAVVLLNENEELNSGFYWGLAIILASVFSYPFFRKKFEPKIRIPS
ncbi:MAG: DMT family transporter [Saprospiraceae bacterium]